MVDTWEQVPLFDLDAGRAARDQAMERVDDPPWKHFAMEALLAVARRQPQVTSDDVWQELDRMGIPRPGEGRAMGPVMMAAVRQHMLVPIGYERGANPKHHADLMRVYRSAEYQGGAL